MKLRISLCLMMVAICSPMYGEWGWLALKAGAGYTKPVGSLERRVNHGYHFNGGAGTNLGPYFSILAEYHFHDMSLSENFLQRNSIPGGNTYIQSVTVNPVLRMGGDRAVSPYVTGGWGYYRRNVQFTQPAIATFTAFDPWWGVLYPAAAPTNLVLANHVLNKTGWNAGAGLDFKIRRAKVFVEARYHRIETRPVPTTFIPITGGFRW